jgi:hypothetical protein
MTQSGCLINSLVVDWSDKSGFTKTYLNLYPLSVSRPIAGFSIELKVAIGENLPAFVAWFRDSWVGVRIMNWSLANFVITRGNDDYAMRNT